MLSTVIFELNSLNYKTPPYEKNCNPFEVQKGGESVKPNYILI